MRAVAVLAACLAVVLEAAAWPARAQSYATLANQPDPRDFVARANTRLTQSGSPMRFAGYDIGWLGVRPDGTPPPSPPNAYEIADALSTVQALGGTVVRVQPVRPTGEALAILDLVLKTARDMGLKVIVPLADSGGACGTGGTGIICAILRRHRLDDARAFFTDAGVRADFLAGVALVIGHTNTLTGTAYHDDPTIMAWENCLACAAGADGDAASWVESLGHALKLADPRHLYESGAFAGRIEAQAPHAAPAAVFATPSVDIVGDDLATGPDPVAARVRLGGVAGAVAGTGKVYVLDSIGWTPAMWKTLDDVQGWGSAISRQRSLTGVVVGRLEAHAATGGFMPVPPAVPAQGVAGLYFPGIKTADMAQSEMQARGRALRHMGYTIADITVVPAYLLPPRPEIISAVHGHVLWRGAAGAAGYTIERSPDPSAPNTWSVVCDDCVTDMSGGWQDAAVPSGPVWYRIFPFNINGHKSGPSEAVEGSK